MATCDDSANHQPVAGFTNVTHPCHQNVQACPDPHPNHGPAGFQVCTTCHGHSLYLLRLGAPGIPIPTNRSRLSQGFAFNIGAAQPTIPQSGVGPPEVLNGVWPALPPLLPPFITPWQQDLSAGHPSNNEFDTGRVRAPPRAQPLFPLFDGFLTRVCQDCEILIQSEIRLRSTLQIAQIMSQTNKWERYPEISCTCKWELGISGNHPFRCRTHLDQVWNQLQATRDRNDAWLRQVWRNPQTGQLEMLGPTSAVLRRRVRRPGTYRACRCGKDIDHTLVTSPEVYVCMACEGWVSRYGAWSYYWPHPAPGALFPPPGTHLLNLKEVNRKHRQYDRKYRMGRN